MTMHAPPAVTVRGLSHRYGKTRVLDALDLTIPPGAIYALFGANGAGKSTLLRLLAGIDRVQHGDARVFAMPVASLPIATRQRIAYVAEGQRLPGAMRLEQLEAYVAPLYPTWDRALAASLRGRFDLDPRQKTGAMSRGQRMKVALLLALAARPSLLLMDEPFTGMDAAVKDDLVRGLLESGSEEGWTVVAATHDIAEMETLADWVGFLRDGRIAVSSSLEELRARYRRVELTLPSSAVATPTWPSTWLAVERAGQRVSALVADDDHTRIASVHGLAGAPVQVDVHPVSLKELYLALGAKRATEQAA